VQRVREVQGLAKLCDNNEGKRSLFKVIQTQGDLALKFGGTRQVRREKRREDVVGQSQGLPPPVLF